MSWSSRDKMLLLENIEMYISAGLTMHVALKIASSSFSVRQNRSLVEVYSHVSQGQLLSFALSRHINFPSALISLIEHGEQSGDIRQSLRLARMSFERQDTLISACISALTYPVVIALFAGTLTLGLMTWVMPQIIPLLRSLHVDLPLLTRLVIFASENIMSYGLYVCAVYILAAIIVLYAYKTSHAVRFHVQKVFLLVPVFGQLYRQYHLSLVFRSFGALISSGEQMRDAYVKVTEKISLLPVKSYFLRQTFTIDQGVSLSSIILSFRKIPKYVSPLIAAGEASGTLGSSLMRVADIIDRDIEQTLKRLTALIEPLMMIGVGSIIGAIALSIMMPIYEVSKTLQH